MAKIILCLVFAACMLSLTFVAQTITSPLIIQLLFAAIMVSGTALSVLFIMDIYRAWFRTR